MRLDLNLVAGARVEDGIDTAVVYVRGMVYDIDVDAQNCRTTLIRALEAAGMPQKNEPYAPYPKCRLKDRIITPAGNVDTAAIELRYRWDRRQSPEASPHLWVLEDLTGASATRAEIDPTGAPLVIKYREPGGNRVKDYPFDATVEETLRVLRATGYFQKPPSVAIQRSHNHVNHAAWEGYPRGFWRVTGVLAGTEDGLYRLSVEVTSRVNRDWSAWGVFHGVDGQVPADLDRDGILAVCRKPYAVGQDWSVNGFTRAGLYPVLNYGATFF